MKNDSPIQKKLFQILEKEEFDKLAHYHDPASWTKWNVDDRFSLAVLFLKNGERLLQTDPDNGWKSFEHSLSIAPEALHIRQQIARYCLALPLSPEILSKVTKVIAETAALASENPEILIQWAMAIYRQDPLEGDESYLHIALEKLHRAETLVDQNVASSDIKAQLYWTFSNIWHTLGKMSGEATEYCHAIEYYRKAAQYSADSWEFWRGFGDACSELAYLLINTDYIQEAINCYQRSLKINNDIGGTWLSLAYVFHYLFDLTLAEGHSECAYEAYEKAASLLQDNDQLWVKCGALLISMGKLKNLYSFIEEGIEKFKEAYRINPHHPKLNILWADALLIAAAQEDSLELLKVAEERIMTALKESVEDAQAWYIYGLCLNGFGRYFDDASFHKKALDKLVRAIELEPNDGMLWHAVAMTHLETFSHDFSQTEIDKALRAFSRAVEINPKGWPQLWNDWGVALMKLGESTGDKHYIEASLVKFENVMKTSQLSGYEEADLHPEWLYNYGCALDFLGEYYSDQDFYEKSIHMLTRALQLDPNFHHARYNLAITLSHLAEVAGDLELFYKAQEQFATVVSENEEEDYSWNEWGMMCMHAAELVAEDFFPDKAKEWLEQAESKFLRAASLGSSIAFYNLACLYSLLYQPKQALYYLQKAQQVGSLPPMETLLEDLWLENIRGTEEFRDFLHKIT